MSGDSETDSSIGCPSLWSPRVVVPDSPPGGKSLAHLPQLGEIAGRKHPGDRLTDHLLGRIAVEPLGAGVPAGDGAVEGRADDRVVGRLDDRGQAPDLALGLAASCDVVEEGVEHGRVADAHR